MRLTSEGMSLINRSNSRASAGESFTPLSMTYSQVILCVHDRPGNWRHASISSAILNCRLMGTSSSLSVPETPLA